MSNDAISTLVRWWIDLAKEDLDSARKLASPPDPQPRTTVYHCQQAAEKALKGLLAKHDLPEIRTHDLKNLVDTLGEHEPSLLPLAGMAAALSGYATEYRYPNPDVEPLSEIDVSNAIADAEAILNQVLLLLPPEFHLYGSP